MAGKIKKTIDIIIQKRSNGNPTIMATTKTKLLLKGINPSKYDDNSEDDPVILEKLKNLASELSIELN